MRTLILLFACAFQCILLLSSVDPSEVGNLTLQESAEVKERVVKGQFAENGQFPWMAQIERTDPKLKEKFECSGFIISRTAILTAAHCVKKKEMEYTVIVGDVSKKEAKTSLKHFRGIQHPDYNPDKFTNDVGILQMEKDTIHFQKNVKSICLGEDPDENLHATIMGWGKTEKDNCMKDQVGKTSGTLLYTDHKIIDISEKTITTKSNGNELCQGDSGGPLVQYRNKKAVAMGITSTNLNGKNTFTRIGAYKKFIKKHAGDVQFC